MIAASCIFPGHMAVSLAMGTTTTRTLDAEIARGVRQALRGRTIAQLSLSSGIALRTLHRRMTGLSAWTTREIATIADALGVDVAALILPSLAADPAIWRDSGSNS